MSLLDSPLSSVHLREHPKRFKTVLGLTVEEFDALFEKIYTLNGSCQKKRHRLWTSERIERMVEKERPLLREYLTLTLIFLRQYPIQEALAASFGISQGQVSKIIERISGHLEQVLPTPQVTLKAILKFVETLPFDLLDDSAAPIIIDATEQRIERSHDKAQQQQDYSGKKSATAVSFNSSSRRTS